MGAELGLPIVQFLMTSLTSEVLTASGCANVGSEGIPNILRGPTFQHIEMESAASPPFIFVQLFLPHNTFYHSIFPFLSHHPFFI